MNKSVFKKWSWLSVLSIFAVLCLAFMSEKRMIKLNENNNPVQIDTIKPSLYQTLHLDAVGLSQQAYKYAMAGFNKLKDAGKIKNSSIVSIVDFSLPSTVKRLFVIDLENGKLLFNTYVAHGKNSGAGMATSFSNSPESFKSSLGFYVTADTYNGKHGYALRLEGEEKGINDNAYSRGIVMHSADYVSESTIHSLGYLGRSQGCPAVPADCYQAIISKIKNGTCLFMYSPVKFYASSSELIKDTTAV